MAHQTSVIIPCFNSSAWIRATLRSVVAQNQEGLDVIVIDDGSTDNSAEIVREEFAFVNLVRTPNRGASQARNLGTSLAHGEFIQYLDADDVLAEGKIRAQLEALERSGADVAYGDWQKLAPSPAPGLKCDFVPGEVVARAIEGDPETALFGDFWCPPAAYLFRRGIVDQVVDQVGGWNESLPVIQDARFALDCALCGGRFVHTPGIAAYYRAHEAGSLSRRNPVAFGRDVYRNAQQVEAWWREHGGVDESRRNALKHCLGNVARSSFKIDPETFERALADLERLGSGPYTPEGPPHLRIASKLIGYRRAEQAASWYRKTKQALAGVRA
jgi:glycosyltransferase involved in cell wall biosynthesis